MTAFSVDLDALDAVTARLAAFVTAVDARLADVDAHVAEVSRLWTGPASSAHLDGHVAWSTAAREMHRGLDRLRSAAATAHTSYSAAVQANLRMFGES